MGSRCEQSGWCLCCVVNNQDGVVFVLLTIRRGSFVLTIRRGLFVLLTIRMGSSVVVNNLDGIMLIRMGLFVLCCSQSGCCRTAPEKCTCLYDDT